MNDCRSYDEIYSIIIEVRKVIRESDLFAIPADIWHVRQDGNAELAEMSNWDRAHHPPPLPCAEPTKVCESSCSRSHRGETSPAAQSFHRKHRPTSDHQIVTEGIHWYWSSFHFWFGPLQTFLSICDFVCKNALNTLLSSCWVFILYFSICS